jgi:glutamate formiminotransferase
VSVIECVPNVSEGRREAVVTGCATAMQRAGAVLLDVNLDATHNRSVLTCAGDETTLAAAVVALFDRAIAEIDLRRHSGEHPRIGAVDVVPFVPLAETAMIDCAELARRVAAAVASRHRLPIFLYEEASPPGRRRALEAIRRGGLAALAARMAQPDWAPDFGPSRPHPTAGVSVVGARPLLIAYNVNLATSRLEIAKQVAVAVRQSSGGLPSVKAIAVDLADRGLVQVSMNLTNFRQTSIARAFDAVVQAASRLGVDVLESELIGLAPEAALSASVAAHVKLKNFGERMILEHRLRALGLV